MLGGGSTLDGKTGRADFRGGPLSSLFSLFGIKPFWIRSLGKCGDVGRGRSLATAREPAALEFLLPLPGRGLWGGG